MHKFTLLVFFCTFLFCQPAMAFWSQNDMDWESVPRLLYGPGEQVEIASRLDREPFLTLYKRTLSKANQGYELDNHDKYKEQAKANIAKAAAFVYAMNKTVDDKDQAVDFATEEDRLAYGRKAELLLLNMKTTSRMTSFPNMVLDIHTSQELQCWATAYDILAGAGYPFEKKDQVVTNVVDLAADFYQDWVADQFPAVNSLNNNHMVKSAAALGVAAIALNGYAGYLEEEDPFGYRKPENWINLAIVLTDRIALDAQIPRDGGYGEGAGYYHYSAINHLPFFRALHRYVGPEGFELDGFNYGDFLFREKHLLINDWLVRTIMPDGTYPPIDDNSPGSQLALGEVVDLPNGALYRWAWDFQRIKYYSSGSIDQSVETLVFFDENVDPLSPVDLGWKKNQFLYDAGISIFRSDWEDRNAIYLHMTDEHGIAKGTPVTRLGNELEGAGGHDHNDPNVIHMHAYGSPLLLDPGYLGWDNHSLVYNADNHNLILVDDRGPALFKLVLPMLVQDENGEWVVKEGDEGGYVPGKDGDAYINDHFDYHNLSYTRGDTSYFEKAPETDWSRHVIFVREKYFIVFDEMHFLDDESHTASLLWHGHGGGNSGGTFEELNEGGKWQFDEAKVQVLVSSAEGEIDFTTEENYHDPGNRRELTHTVLRSSVDNKNGTSFVSLLLPEPAKNSNLSAEKMDNGAWWKITDLQNSEDEKYLEGFAAANEISELTACKGFNAKAKGFFCSSYETELLRYLLLSGTELKNTSDEVIFSSDAPVRIFAEWLITDRPGITLSGSVDLLGSESVTVKFKRPELEKLATASGVCNAEIDSEGMLSLSFNKSGEFRVWLETGSPLSIKPQAVAIAEPEMVDMGGTSIINPFLSCPENGELSYQYKLVEKPEYSMSFLKSMGDNTVSLETDYYGIYLVELTVSDGVNQDSDIVRISTFPSRPDDDEEIESELEGDEDFDSESSIDGDEDLEMELESELELEEEVDAEVSDEDEDFDQTDITDGDTEKEPDATISGSCQNTNSFNMLVFLCGLLLILRRFHRRSF